MVGNAAATIHTSVATLAATPTTAVASTRTAAATSTPRPAYTEGEATYRGKDYAGALIKFQPPAAEGHAPALFRVGQFALAGWGVPRDASKANHHLLLAAAQGCAAAQNALGLLHDGASVLHGPNPNRCGSAWAWRHTGLPTWFCATN